MHRAQSKKKWLNVFRFTYFCKLGFFFIFTILFVVVCVWTTMSMHVQVSVYFWVCDFKTQATVPQRRPLCVLSCSFPGPTVWLNSHGNPLWHQSILTGAWFTTRCHLQPCSPGKLNDPKITLICTREQDRGRAVAERLSLSCNGSHLWKFNLKYGAHRCSGSEHTIRPFAVTCTERSQVLVKG